MLQDHPPCAGQPAGRPGGIKFPRKVPAGEALSRYEAPRGEDVHYVRANGTDKPERVKVRAPTMANAASVAHMLKGGYLADVPIVIAAIDPCFSCTDRVALVRDTEKRQRDHNGLERAAPIQHRLVQGARAWTSPQ